jgi:prepilin peptidase CpaA
MSLSLLQSWPSAITPAMTLASGGVLLLAAWHDVVSRTVPNWMSAVIACFGIVAAYTDGRLAMSIGLGLAVFLVAAICWRRGWMGGADVKLLGAVVIVLPPGMVSLFAIAMSLAGAAHAITYMVARRVVTPPAPLVPALASRHASTPTRPGMRRLSLPSRALRAERWRISRGGPLPYACAIAFGYLFVICNGAAP